MSITATTTVPPVRCLSACLAFVSAADPGVPLIAVVGATGTGKSDLSLDFADAIASSGLRAEIVNADAMQLYRGMDIGTAKLTVPERRGHPHHLLDVLEVTEESTVAEYQQRARLAIEGIEERGAVPILVGGSGLYVSGVLFDFRFPGRSAEARARLEQELESVGVSALFQRLLDADPEVAKRVGPHNGRRIVRALEVIEVEGVPVSGSLPDAPVPWRPARVVGARLDRAVLVTRLDARVEVMWRRGLLDEVAALLDRGLRGSPTAGRAIGYAQAAAELDGTLSRREAIAQAQSLTRRYARRQVSWFARYPGVHWTDASDPAERAAAIAWATGSTSARVPGTP